MNKHTIGIDMAQPHCDHSAIALAHLIRSTDPKMRIEILNCRRNGKSLAMKKLAIYLRYKAACRAVGIVNKLKSGPFRAKHASRVFTNLNKIKGLL